MTAEDISAGARTVAHLATYFEELKQSAQQLADQARVRSRGYFTPEEEDRTRCLQLSYWKSRSALLELITSFRRDTDVCKGNRPAGFLVAFAAAVILVDAARFLRELFHDHPMARRKLNEPAPMFDIPGGTYDKVQRSLVSARHAWHLYYALKYLDENEADLEQLARDEELAPVWAVIARLRHRLDVSVTQFAKAKLRIRSGQMARSVARNVFGRALYGLQKLAAGMMADVYVRPGHEPRIPDEIARALDTILAPGDVLIVRKKYALTNYFLPGYWPHSALYLGQVEDLERLGIRHDQTVRPRWARLLPSPSGPSGQGRKVLESMKDGVLIRSLASPLASDSLVVLRPRLTEDHLAQALVRAIVHEGKPYDFDFDFTRSDRLVCTEVAFRAYDGMGGIQLALTRRAGRLTLSGSDLIAMGLRRENFDPVVVFAPDFASGLVAGKDADNVLSQAEQSAGAEDV